MIARSNADDCADGPTQTVQRTGKRRAEVRRRRRCFNRRRLCYCHRRLRRLRRRLVLLPSRGGRLLLKRRGLSRGGRPFLHRLLHRRRAGCGGVCCCGGGEEALPLQEFKILASRLPPVKRLLHLTA